MITDVYQATLNTLKVELVKRQNGISISLMHLPNRTTDYAKTHIKAIQVYNELLDVLDKHMQEKV